MFTFMLPIVTKVAKYMLWTFCTCKSGYWTKIIFLQLCSAPACLTVLFPMICQQPIRQDLSCSHHLILDLLHLTSQKTSNYLAHQVGNFNAKSCFGVTVRLPRYFIVVFRGEEYHTELFFWRVDRFFLVKLQAYVLRLVWWNKGIFSSLGHFAFFN